MEQRRQTMNRRRADSAPVQLEMQLEDSTQRHAWLDVLTPREREVMALLVEGRANKVIADQLDISIRTVEVHRQRILAKLGARNAVQLVWIMHHRILAGE